MTTLERKQKHKSEMEARRRNQNSRQSRWIAAPQKQHDHARENSRRLRQIAMGFLNPFKFLKPFKAATP